MAKRRDWNESYANGDLPWDTGAPDPLLVDAVERGLVAKGRALEIGCGTGTNALWLADHGFDVLGVDLAPLAVAQANKKLTPGARCRFETLDFLAGTPSSAPFAFVFDRGCVHTFHDAGVRARFAARVAAILDVGGAWLSLCGSTEGAPRDGGPPRRSARELVEAIEPVLELVTLRAASFTTDIDVPAWLCLSRRRAQPAQPPSVDRG
jgi:SAM-dependent methyltransferase